MPAAGNLPSGPRSSEISDGIRIEGSVAALMRTILAAVIATMFATGLPAFAAASESGKEVRVVGCVQWEKDYLKKSWIGDDNEFVLTMVKPDATRKATAYSITGDREKELGRRIGQQVEVIGIIEDEGKPEANRVADVPRIKMTAWVPVKDSCPQ
jgi:hypothetical protein